MAFGAVESLLVAITAAERLSVRLTSAKTIRNE
jgi:hypothetical protein